MMKKTLSRIGFSFRFAFQNIIHFKIRSILLIFSFITLTAVILLGLSNQPFVEKYYQEELASKYRLIDFHMGVSENTNTRFFSITPLVNSLSAQEVIEEYYSFFEMNTLIGGEKFDKTYVKVFASTLPNLRKISGQIHFTEETLSYTQTIITQSLAMKYQLVENDFIDLYVGDSSKQYQIVEIVEDDGLFRGDAIYLNKEGSLLFFLSALNPELGSLNPLFLKNLYNHIYFTVKGNSNIEESLATIKAIPAYSSLEFEAVYNHEVMSQLINRSVSVFNVVIGFVFLAVFLVMQTTFLLFFEGKKQMLSIVGLLGGNRRFSYGVVLIEMILFFAISSLISIWVTSIIMSKGLEYIGSTSTYHLNTVHIIASMLITATIFIGTSIYYFYRYNQHSEIEQSKDQGQEQLINNKFLIIVIIGSALLYTLLELMISVNQSWLWISLIQMLISLIILFALATVLIYITSKLLLKSKNKSLFAMQIKILVSKKAFFQYLSIMLVCFISVFLLVETNDHMERKISRIKDEYNVEYALTNFVSRFVETLEEVQNLEVVESADEVLIYYDAIISDINQNINFMISMDPTKINDYFNFSLKEELIDQLSSTQNPVVVLPNRYGVLYNLHIGDEIHFNLSPVYQDVSFTIVGFYDKQAGNMAFFNMRYLDRYPSLKSNTIFINSNGNSTLLKQELVDRYSKNLVYVIDYNEVTTGIVSQMKSTTQYMTYIIGALVVCFILSILNHSVLLYEQMKKSYTKVYVVGASKKQLMASVIKEHLLVLFVIVISSLLTTIMLSSQLSNLILLFGEYELVYLTKETVIIGLIISNAIYVFSSAIYVIRLASLKPSDVLKTF